jgi:hypothetical protein
VDVTIWDLLFLAALVGLVPMAALGVQALWGRMRR